MVSVVIPIYKVEEYLRECVDSVINQTYTDLEIILVDDGSPDNCGKICDEYASKDSRVVVIHKENGGQSDAKNVGFSVARGKYVYFLDSDDYIRNDSIECLVRIAEHENPDFVFFGGVSFVDGSDKMTPVFEIADKYPLQSGADTLVQRYQQGEYMPGGPLHFYSTAFLKKEQLSFEKGIIYEDFLFSAKAYLRANQVAACYEPLYFYRIRSGSTMTSKPGIYNLRCFLVCVQKIAEERSCYAEGSAQVKALDYLVKHAAHEFMHVYGETSGEARKEAKQMLKEIHTEIKRVKTIGCRKLRLKYTFPGLWVLYYSFKKKT